MSAAENTEGRGRHRAEGQNGRQRPMILLARGLAPCWRRRHFFPGNVGARRVSSGSVNSLSLCFSAGAATWPELLTKLSSQSSMYCGSVPTEKRQLTWKPQRSQRHRLGRYTLIEHLATGGMAEIFLARHEAEARSARNSCSRSYSRVGGTSGGVDMFLGEARIARSSIIQHRRRL